MLRKIVFILVVFLTIGDCFSLPVTISVTQKLGELGYAWSSTPKAYPRIYVSDREIIKKLELTVNFSPFKVIGVESMDKNFSLSFQANGGKVKIQLNRIGSSNVFSDGLIKLTLDTLVEGGLYIGIFGEFFILEAKAWNLNDSEIENIQCKNGSWLVSSDLIYYTEIRVFDRYSAQPVPNVLVVAEFIGRVGLFYFDETDENGIADIFFLYLTSREDPSKYLPDLDFSAQFITQYSARIIVWPQSKPYETYIQVHELIRDGEFVQDFTVYLTPLFSQVANFALYD